MTIKRAKLFLEDGSSYIGESFGATSESMGELVFNTSMTGYQEILTDPSYYGQLVVMTYPLIGNYGINPDDFESIKPKVFGFVVREYAEHPSHWRENKSLDQYLAENNIPGISGVDTRMITKKIRNKGTMKALLTTEELTEEEVHLKLQEPLYNQQVSRVSIKEPFTMPGKGRRIVLIDYGYKQGILRELIERKCEVTVVPYDASYELIKGFNPDGVILSNGPGDPKDVKGTTEIINRIIEDKLPLFGICLGHQLFALANEADTEKMKFGHRGGNHPVKDLFTNKLYLTSQNHGYTVMMDSIKNTQLEITHIAINDNTVEGLIHKEAPAFSVQFHPEAAPGPNDSSDLFDKFLDLINKSKGGN